MTTIGKPIDFRNIVTDINGRDFSVCVLDVHLRCGALCTFTVGLQDIATAKMWVSGIKFGTDCLIEYRKRESNGLISQFLSYELLSISPCTVI